MTHLYTTSMKQFGLLHKQLSRNTRVFIIGLTSVFLINTTHGQESTSELAGEICNNNDYALCSHAPCQCYDDNGIQTVCTEYPTGSDVDPTTAPSSSWAVCECPIVKTNKSDNPVYNYNYASSDLACSLRETPPPTFDDNAKNADNINIIPNGTQTDLYSAYSYGDSLTGTAFDTKDSAKSVICETPSLFTDCLSMACYIADGENHATCYCQNRSTENACAGQPLGWNTFGTNSMEPNGVGSNDCNTDQCQLGNGSIWSAACIDDTQNAIVQIAAVLEKDNINVKQLPAYCP